MTQLALAVPDRTRLEELELVVERGLGTFVEVGLALAEIRDARLYRETHGTFEAYLDERWDMSRSRGYRLIDGARIAELVSPTGDVPANEAQARELLPLLKEEEAAVVDVWRELRDEYGAENVTAKKVRGFVRRRLERRRREEQAKLERANQRARFVDSDGLEFKFERHVTYSTPRQQLDEDFLRILDEVEDLRTDLGRRMCSQALDAFCRDWRPYVGVGDAIRGKRAAIPEGGPAAKLLSPVNRDLFEREDVVEALRAIDDALEAERAAFCIDFASWVEERASRIGETLGPHYDRLERVVDGLPETQLVKSVDYRGRYVR